MGNERRMGAGKPIHVLDAPAGVRVGHISEHRLPDSAHDLRTGSVLFMSAQHIIFSINYKLLS
jgi:hypothetical protein